VNGTRLALLAPVAALAACVFHHQEFRSLGVQEASLAAPAAKTVVVRNNVGDVRVETAETDRVSVRANVQTRLAPEKIPSRTGPHPDLLVAQEGDVVRVENAHLDTPDDEDWKMDITLTVPRGVDVRVSNGVGDCAVAGTSGRVEVDLGVGDLEVRAERVGGGMIKIGVGDVTLRVSKGGPDGDLSCESGVGDVAIVVPASFEGEVDLATGVGDVSVDGASGVTVERNVVGGSARGRIGSAETSLRCRTGTGDVSLRRGAARVD